MDDGKDECGLIITTGQDDPMLEACLIHDKEYTAHHDGTSTRTETEVDTEFVNNMINIAEEEPSFWIKIGLTWETAIYGTIVGSVGWVAWKWI